MPVVEPSGRPTSIGAAAAGRVTLVTFWATWCEACLREQPALARLARAAEARGGAVLGVAIGEAPETVRAATSKRPLGFPTLIDEPMATSEALGIARLPALVVLDANGAALYVGDALDARALAAFRRALGVE
jgi:cytochrome c biogenesis protein CcmG/thiol:disulfide interchange protein DsbE